MLRLAPPQLALPRKESRDPAFWRRHHSLTLFQPSGAAQGAGPAHEEVVVEQVTKTVLKPDLQFLLAEMCGHLTRGIVGEVNVLVHSVPALAEDKKTVRGLGYTLYTYLMPWRSIAMRMREAAATVERVYTTTLGVDFKLKHDADVHPKTANPFGLLDAQEAAVWRQTSSAVAIDCLSGAMLSLMAFPEELFYLREDIGHMRWRKDATDRQSYIRHAATLQALFGRTQASQLLHGTHPDPPHRNHRFLPYTTAAACLKRFESVHDRLQEFAATLSEDRYQSMVATLHKCRSMMLSCLYRCLLHACGKSRRSGRTAQIALIEAAIKKWNVYRPPVFSKATGVTDAFQSERPPWTNGSADTDRPLHNTYRGMLDVIITSPGPEIVTIFAPLLAWQLGARDVSHMSHTFEEFIKQGYLTRCMATDLQHRGLISRRVVKGLGLIVRSRACRIWSDDGKKLVNPFGNEWPLYIVRVGVWTQPVFGLAPHMEDPVRTRRLVDMLMASGMKHVPPEHVPTAAPIAALQMRWAESGLGNMADVPGITMSMDEKEHATGTLGPVSHPLAFRLATIARNTSAAVRDVTGVRSRGHRFGDDPKVNSVFVPCHGQAEDFCRRYGTSETSIWTSDIDPERLEVEVKIVFEAVTEVMQQVQELSAKLPAGHGGRILHDGLDFAPSAAPGRMSVVPVNGVVASDQNFVGRILLALLVALASGAEMTDTDRESFRMASIILKTLAGLVEVAAQRMGILLTGDTSCGKSQVVAAIRQLMIAGSYMHSHQVTKNGLQPWGDKPMFCVGLFEEVKAMVEGAPEVEALTNMCLSVLERNMVNKNMGTVDNEAMVVQRTGITYGTSVFTANAKVLYKPLRARCHLVPHPRPIVENTVPASSPGVHPSMRVSPVVRHLQMVLAKLGVLQMTGMAPAVSLANVDLSKVHQVLTLAMAARGDRKIDLHVKGSNTLVSPRNWALFKGLVYRFGTIESALRIHQGLPFVFHVLSLYYMFMQEARLQRGLHHSAWDSLSRLRMTGLPPAMVLEIQRAAHQTVTRSRSPSPTRSDSLPDFTNQGPPAPVPQQVLASSEDAEHDLQLARALPDLPLEVTAQVLSTVYPVDQATVLTAAQHMDANQICQDLTQRDLLLGFGAWILQATFYNTCMMAPFVHNPEKPAPNNSQLPPLLGFPEWWSGINKIPAAVRVAKDYFGAEDAYMGTGFRNREVHEAQMPRNRKTEFRDKVIVKHTYNPSFEPPTGASTKPADLWSTVTPAGLKLLSPNLAKKAIACTPDDADMAYALLEKYIFDVYAHRLITLPAGKNLWRDGLGFQGDPSTNPKYQDIDFQVFTVIDAAREHLNWIQLTRAMAWLAARAAAQCYRRKLDRLEPHEILTKVTGCVKLCLWPGCMDLSPHTSCSPIDGSIDTKLGYVHCFVDGKTPTYDPTTADQLRQWLVPVVHYTNEMVAKVHKEPPGSDVIKTTLWSSVLRPSMDGDVVVRSPFKAKRVFSPIEDEGWVRECLSQIGSLKQAFSNVFSHTIESIRGSLVADCVLEPDIYAAAWKAVEDVAYKKLVAHIGMESTQVYQLRHKGCASHPSIYATGYLLLVPLGGIVAGVPVTASAHRDMCGVVDPITKATLLGHTLTARGEVSHKAMRGLPPTAEHYQMAEEVGVDLPSGRIAEAPRRELSDSEKRTMIDRHMFPQKYGPVGAGAGAGAGAAYGPPAMSLMEAMALVEKEAEAAALARAGAWPEYTGSGQVVWYQKQTEDSRTGANFRAFDLNHVTQTLRTEPTTTIASSCHGLFPHVLHNVDVCADRKPEPTLTYQTFLVPGPQHEGSELSTIYGHTAPHAQVLPIRSTSEAAARTKALLMYVPTYRAAAADVLSRLTVLIGAILKFVKPDLSQTDRTVAAQHMAEVVLTCPRKGASDVLDHLGLPKSLYSKPSSDLVSVPGLEAIFRQNSEAGKRLPPGYLSMLDANRKVVDSSAAEVNFLGSDLGRSLLMDLDARADKAPYDRDEPLGFNFDDRPSAYLGPGSLEEEAHFLHDLAAEWLAIRADRQADFHETFRSRQRGEDEKEAHEENEADEPELAALGDDFLAPDGAAEAEVEPVAAEVEAHIERPAKRRRLVRPPGGPEPMDEDENDRDVEVEV